MLGAGIAIGVSSASFNTCVFLIFVYPTVGRGKKGESWSEKRKKLPEERRVESSEGYRGSNI